MRKRVKKTKSGAMDPKTAVEDLQIFLQYVKSALRCALDDCLTIDSVKDTVDELISEIDKHLTASGDPSVIVLENHSNKPSKKKASHNKTNPKKAKENVKEVKATGDVYEDDSNDTTDYFNTVGHSSDLSDGESDQTPDNMDDPNYVFKNDLKMTLNGEDHMDNDENNRESEGDDTSNITCKICEKEFKSIKLLNEHRKVHSKDSKALKCLVCNIGFTRKKSLLMHILENNHVVTVDGSVTDIVSGLNDIELRDFRAKLHTCCDCGKQFTKASLLKVHKMVHVYESRDKSDYTCNICNNKFNQSVSLKVHLVKVHGANIEIPTESEQLKTMSLTCEYCGKEFRRASSLLLHRKTHTKGKVFNCKECKNEFNSKDELEKHIATCDHRKKIDKTKLKPESWQCELCGELFTKKTEYYDHFNSHKMEEGFKCPACDRYFSRKENLKWHMATLKHTFEGNEGDSSVNLASSLFGMKVLSCDLCGKKFNKPSSLRLHLSKHTGEKVYKCQECDKAFTRKYLLTEHMSEHHDNSSGEGSEKGKEKRVAKKREGLYTCPKCGKNYSTPVSLRAHIARHDGMKFKCNDCGKLFMRKESLQMHVVREGHNMGKDLTEFSKKLISCNICGKKLLRPSLLVKHMKSHTGNAPAHFCAKCLEVFETDAEKHAHMCPVKQNQKVKSEGNSKAFQEENSQLLQDEISKILQEQKGGAESKEEVNPSLEEAYKNMSVDELESLLKMTGEAAEFLNAPVANETTEEKVEKQPTKKPRPAKDPKSTQRMRAYFINKALRMKSEKGKFKKEGKTYYKCMYCPKYFARRGVTQNHERRHTGSKPFKCPTCNRAFSMIQTLKNHLLTHAEEKPHKCTVCDKGFVQKPSLMRHMFMHTGQVLPHRCDVCNKAFYREGELKKHKEKHDGTLSRVSHICEQCGKSFCTKQGLKNHAMLHEPIKKYYNCEVCNRQFTMAIRLKKHMLVHSDERPFICNYCGKRFARSHYLTNHIRVHTGEKRFKCSYCFKGFTTSGQLSIHTRSHTGEKPYACSICGKRSTDSANHIKHMRTHQDKSNANTGKTSNMKHKASSNMNTSNIISNPVPPNPTFTTMTNTVPHLHNDQSIDRHMTTYHTENLISMKNVRPMDSDNLLQPMHNPMQLVHNPMPPDAHGQARLTRPATNFFNPMQTGHLPLPNSGYPDSSQFVFRYNDRM